MGDMETAPAYVTHRIDIDGYHRMAAAGVFDPDLRIELIDGESIQRVAPMYLPHAGGVSNQHFPPSTSPLRRCYRYASNRGAFHAAHVDRDSAQCGVSGQLVDP